MVVNNFTNLCLKLHFSWTNLIKMIFTAPIPQHMLCHLTIHFVSIFIRSVGTTSVKPNSAGEGPSLILSWLAAFFLGTRIQNLVAVCCFSMVRTNAGVAGRSVSSCVTVHCEGGLPVFLGVHVRHLVIVPARDSAEEAVLLAPTQPISAHLHTRSPFMRFSWQL